MDDVDKKLLNFIQEDFPVTAVPFAESLGLNEGNKK
jgi:DNA-binding Lrp family transcriptional regulator